MYCTECTWKGDYSQLIKAGTIDVCPQCEGDVITQDLCHKILSLVEERGYKEGWTDAQFVFRQCLKAMDELTEVLEHFEASGPAKTMIDEMVTAGSKAKAYFKFKRPELFDVKVKETSGWVGIHRELPDTVIPLLTGHAVTGGTVADIEAKALADVERGTNYNGGSD